jgi:hypothetical protein
MNGSTPDTQLHCAGHFTAIMLTNPPYEPGWVNENGVISFRYFLQVVDDLPEVKGKIIADSLFLKTRRGKNYDKWFHDTVQEHGIHYPDSSIYAYQTSFLTCSSIDQKLIYLDRTWFRRDGQEHKCCIKTDFDNDGQLRVSCLGLVPPGFVPEIKGNHE